MTWVTSLEPFEIAFNAVIGLVVLFAAAVVVNDALWRPYRAPVLEPVMPEPVEPSTVPIRIGVQR